MAKLSRTSSLSPSRTLFASRASRMRAYRVLALEGCCTAAATVLLLSVREGRVRALTLDTKQKPNPTQAKQANMQSGRVRYSRTTVHHIPVINVKAAWGREECGEESVKCQEGARDSGSFEAGSIPAREFIPPSVSPGTGLHGTFVALSFSPPGCSEDHVSSPESRIYLWNVGTRPNQTKPVSDPWR